MFKFILLDFASIFGEAPSISTFTFFCLKPTIDYWSLYFCLMTARTSDVKWLAEFIYFRYYWPYNIYHARWTDKCYIQIFIVLLTFTINQMY